MARLHHLTGTRYDALVHSFEKFGHKIGTKDFGDVWVQDGTTWLVDATSARELGDYFEFLEAVNAGKHPDFKMVEMV